jgi:NAD(P)-dependent dehydrogenase (short-subunit alcohol dehydrogenase family)
MLPHGAQGSWEGSAVYLAKELRDTRIRVNAADPGYTATDFNAVGAGEVADFKSGAPAAGRGLPDYPGRKPRPVTPPDPRPRRCSGVARNAPPQALSEKFLGAGCS